MGKVAGFTFDEGVAAVFPDMIQRSVPGYSTVVAISGVLAEHFSQADTRIYDLGCSLGASSFAMAKRAEPSCELMAVDNSKAMLDQLIQRVKAHPLPIALSTIEADICDVEIHNASVVALNYTLQFVELKKRQRLLEKIYRGMVDRGVLILSEKVAFEDPQVGQLFAELHHDFKRANGYSDLEISQKRDAIENVLLPESIMNHKQRLAECGFSRVEVWFQCFNFVSLVAFKGGC
jgi:tRNA (cmo5U34)-methyltransferase